MRSRGFLQMPFKINVSRIHRRPAFKDGMLATPPAPSIPWHGMLEEGYPKGAPQHPVRLGESRWWDWYSGDLHEGKLFRNKDAVKIFPTTLSFVHAITGMVSDEPPVQPLQKVQNATFL